MVVAWIASILLSPAIAAPVGAHASGDGPATRAVYLDSDGVIRWRDSKQEVGLFGANYCIMSGSDYRMAGLVSGDRKAMIDEDMAHFARMGWTALRLCSWGDWENSDKAGNLIVNEHVDLLDYLIASARARGIYILLTPSTYDPAFMTRQQAARTSAFRDISKGEMGQSARSRAGQLHQAIAQSRQPLYGRGDQGRAGHSVHRDDQ